MQSKYPKILVISSWYPNSLHEYEGDFIRYQSNLLQKEDIDISVFHASLSIRYLLKGQFLSKTKRHTEELEETIVEKPFWPRNSSLGTSLWAKTYKKEVEKHCDKNGWPNIIHAHTYLGGLVASLLKKDRNIPYVLTLHSSSIVSDNIPKYHHCFLKNALINADYVLSVGKKLAATIESYTGVSSVVVPNFIDFDQFVILEDAHKPFTFIYVGELIKRKRIGWILKAFTELNKSDGESQLIIIGDGPEKRHLEKEAIRLKIAHSVIFRGRLSQNKVAEQLGKSQCLLLTSKAETFGIVLVEAMACGLPFISTRSGVPEERFNHAECHFVDNLEELVTKMNTVLVSEEERSPIEIRAFAKERFRAKKIVKIYSKIYSSISEKRKP